jgi:transposase-like protein
MITCKNCQNTYTVRHGFVRGKRHYKCHACGYHFVLSDVYYLYVTEGNKFLTIILYLLVKSLSAF